MQSLHFRINIPTPPSLKQNFLNSKLILLNRTIDSVKLKKNLLINTEMLNFLKPSFPQDVTKTIDRKVQEIGQNYGKQIIYLS